MEWMTKLSTKESDRMTPKLIYMLAVLQIV